jgi:Secretion system C-terminal sorting domain
LVQVTSFDNAITVEYQIGFYFDALSKIQKYAITLYPNPTSGIITISEVAIGSTIVVSNILGQHFLERVADQNKVQLSLEGQPGGIYFIQIINDFKILACLKLIVK